MVYITGDMHGEQRVNEIIDFLNSHPETTNLIILGDFGGIWDRNDETIIKELSNQRANILFIDGNHENFDLLEQSPIENWHGGKVHRISHNVLHLMRGSVFEIECKSYFAYGGAESSDKDKRIEHISWWEQETATEKEILSAQRTLQDIRSVDYIITHVGQMETVQELSRFSDKFSVERQSVIVSKLLKNTTCARWYFGHYHFDVDFCNYSCVYKRFIQVNGR